MRQFFNFVGWSLSSTLLCASLTTDVQAHSRAATSARNASVTTEALGRPVHTLPQRLRAASGVTQLSNIPGSPESGLMRVRPASKAPMGLPVAQPRGSLCGVVASFRGIQSASQSYWGEIDPVSGKVENMFSGSYLADIQNYDIQGGAIRNGILYIADVLTSIVAGAQVENIIWRRVDLATGDELTPIYFGEDYAAYAYSMTYDPDKDMFHILSLDQSTYSFGLYATIDPSDGFAVQSHGLLSRNNFLGSIVYNPADTQIYVFDYYNQVFTIDQATDSLIEMGTVDEDYTLVRYQTATAMTYSPLDRSFVACYPDEFTESIKLLFIDDETYSVTESASLYPDNPYLSLLCCTDPYAELEAPAMPAEAIFDFTGAALTGNITITAPELTYGRLPIEQPQVRMVFEVDGNVVFDTEVPVGESRTFAYEGTEGVHETTVTAKIGDKSSPARKSVLCLGNDIPCTPTMLKAENGLLTWEPVGAKGINNGFVDTAAVTYDVFENGVKINDTLLTECSFRLDTDRDLSRLSIGVTASANGLTSEPASLSLLLGNAMPLPFEMVPTKEEFSLFQSFDANGDDTTFGYRRNMDTGDYYVGIDISSTSGADDWLFLPLLAFDKPETLYNLSFSYSNLTRYEVTENLSVYIGRSADPQSMTQLIYSGQNLYEPSPITISQRFALPEAGDYYVGFHCTSRNSYGVVIGNFRVESLEGYSAQAPATPEVSAKAAPAGALKADVTIKAPVVDLVGNALDADDMITYTVTCGEATSKLDLLPGTSGEVSVDVPASGYNSFSVIGTNSKGEGISTNHRLYVGIDRPLAPRNIRYSTSADNMTITMTWDKPEAVGENGGYVDVDNLEYRIYVVEGVAYNHVGTTRECSYSYTVPTTPQHQYHIGPAAINEMGESRYSLFTRETLGTPNPIPLVENFSSNGFAYEPVSYTMSGEFINSFVESIGSVLSMGTGVSTDFNSGGLVIFNTGSVPTKAELVFPKVTTSASQKTGFKLRWLDWKYTPTFSLWARRYGAETLVKLADFEAERPEQGTWKEDIVVLSDGFDDASWVEFRVHADLSTEAKEYGFIDAYELLQNVENDLKVASVTGVTEATVGDEVNFHVRVINAGLEVMNGSLTTTVTDAAGNVLLSESDNIRRLQSNREYLKNVSFDIQAEYLANAPLTVTATVEADEDEVPENDTLSARLEIKAHEAPVVTDLTAERTVNNTVDLAWSEPDLTFGGNDGFEMAEPFVVADYIGQWRNIDFDGRTCWIVNGLEWPNNREPSAWMTIDAEALNIMGDARLAPHSGSQYLMARSCEYDEESGDGMVQASDWLVSPEVAGGTEVTFWLGSISVDYTEYVEVWWSATEPEFDPYVPVTPDENGSVQSSSTNGSFKRLRTFSKSGDEGWEFVNFTLPAEARYFALRYASFDSFGAMIDDLVYTPARLFSWEVAGYKVLRTVDGIQETIADDVQSTSWTDNNPVNGVASYNVITTVLNNGFRKDGPRSNTASVGSALVDDLRALEGVYGVTGAIVAEGLTGQALAIYAVDGKLMQYVNLTSDRQSIPMPSGVYIVKAGNALAKVMVK
ncbi:MAG: choice-of-anchor J domain-containing protein [Muribaculaceae bacterium]|nr:choice-of-anchor J domain-containing protein [Muribaculaceae bacterium]